GIRVIDSDFGSTLNALRQARPELEAFLEQHGFPASTREEGDEQVKPNMVDEYSGTHYRQVQQGYVGTQNIRVRSDDLQKIVTAHKEIIQLAAEGKPVVYASPDYLVRDLEAIKMSLIGAATENARQRAEEFAKVGKVRVGAMRSASQGAFYILSAHSDADSDDYGGAYDKTTIAKKARVVVTIEYGID
ncbi:MAG: SIMPL domain-containing protein, partial [Zoogloeaceae bacterium]|nr:SIMPL domain-containing protein [Zoogloeaceae bacterium]